MSSAAAQLRFAAEFATFLVAGAGLAVVLLRPRLATAAGWPRAALAGGFVAVGLGAFLRGSLVVGDAAGPGVVALGLAGVAALEGSDTAATLLPAPALVMRDRLPPARALLDAGVTVAIASDSNAGTFSGWGQMPLVIGLGATVLGMTLEEALAAATSGGAASLGLSLERGRLAPGLVADLVAWDAEHEGAFALQLGAVRAQRVWVAGREVRPEG